MKRVLIVDDDRWLADILARRLQRENYQTLVAENALDAMTAIDDWSPAAIILDVFMPGPNGLVFLQELQSHSDLAKLPIILCTTSADEFPQEDLTSYGVRFVLDKATMMAPDILAALKKVLA